MSTMTTTHTLKITHGESKARDTYGYPTVTLKDEQGRRFKCMGGGYDMFGTVLAEWLQAAYPDKAARLASRAYYTYTDHSLMVNDRGLYGVYHDTEKGTVRIDGAVGQTTVERLAKEEFGLTIRAILNHRGHTTGWTVTED